eukprot:6203071-Pyramimonas_sp.AAC.1
MLRFVSDFLGKTAQRDERRLADARAQSFKTWVRKSLKTSPGAVHRWTKPKGWQLSTVRTANGLSSSPQDIVESQ